MAIQVESIASEVGIVLRVSGRMDADAAPEFDQTCRRSLVPAAKNLVLDFSGLDFIASAGLSSVLMAGKKVEAQGGRLVLCGLKERIRQIFLFSGLDALFPIFESLEQALKDCRKSADSARR
jgi:anti-anti-sigma factor